MLYVAWVNPRHILQLCWQLVFTMKTYSKFVLHQDRLIAAYKSEAQPRSHSTLSANVSHVRRRMPTAKYPGLHMSTGMMDS